MLGSFLQGRSVHNQRIERLWRDVCSWKIANFKAHFESLELEGRLNPIDEVDLWALHFVYMPLVNRALDNFVDEWNYHKLRTERFSPVALFRRGEFPSIAKWIVFLVFFHSPSRAFTEYAVRSCRHCTSTKSRIQRFRFAVSTGRSGARRCWRRGASVFRIR